MWTQNSRVCSSLITRRSTDPAFPPLPQHRSLHTQTASLVHHLAFYTLDVRALKALRRVSQISIKYLGSIGTASSARHTSGFAQDFGSSMQMSFLEVV